MNEDMQMYLESFLETSSDKKFTREVFQNFIDYIETYNNDCKASNRIPILEKNIDMLTNKVYLLEQAYMGVYPRTELLKYMDSLSAELRHQEGLDELQKLRNHEEYLKGSIDTLKKITSKPTEKEMLLHKY